MNDYGTKQEAASSNMTNSTSSDESLCPYNYCVEDTIYRMVTGSLLFVIVWPFIVQDMKFFPIGRPTAALLGAVLMVVFNVVPQEQVYFILGERGNLEAICLLIGMMMLSHYFKREGLLDMVALWIFKKGKQFRHVLWKACILSAFMSAILTNDATCVILTPLLLNEHTKQNRSPREIAPLLLGIATSANIGSASTFFGNPQNAFIASQTGLSLFIFFITTLPAACVGIAINTGLLYLVYYKVLMLHDGTTDCVAVVPTDQTHVSAVSNGLVTPPTTSMSTESCNEDQYVASTSPPQSENTATNDFDIVYPEHNRLWQNEMEHNLLSQSADNSYTSVDSNWETSLGGLPTSNYGATNVKQSGIANTSMIEAWGKQVAKQKIKKSSNIATTGDSNNICKNSCRNKFFIIWLVIVTLLLIALLAIPPLDIVSFNLGLVPIGAATLTMLVDTLIHRHHSKDGITNVDWTIILMFFGLFVWLNGFENTSLPRRAFKKINRYMKLSSIGGVLFFTLFVVVGSNIFSNVPLVILILGELDTFECGLSDCTQLTGILLAWVSTIAGNFTIIGSVANLIVAEKAKNCANYNLTFWEYLKFGFPSTILVLFTGLPVVYFTAKYVSIDII